MSGQLDDRVVVVTGGSTGIGRATALALSREGARVVVANRSMAGGEETVRQIREASGDAKFIQTDVSQSADVQALITRTVEHYGRVDCAFNNAGYEGMRVLTADLPEDDWHRAL